MDVCVIGLGEIGYENIKELSKKNDVYGVDINKDRLNELKKEGFDVGNKIKKSEVYIVNVYTTEQVLDVLKKVNYDNDPLIIIESTIDPFKIEEIAEFSRQRNLDLVFFPHRYNPNDLEHHIFNLDRIIGGVTKKATDRALNFYSEFMDPKLIHVFSYEIVPLCKVVENSYRFMEIVIAQNLKTCSEEFGIDFEKLRLACNTKWNIEIKEARDGVRGKCLPKDISLLLDYFENPFIREFTKSNEKYKDSFKKK